MKFRKLLWVAVIATVTSCNSVDTVTEQKAEVTEEKKQSRPNVLFIAVDDLRPELNCYGKSWVKSPNLDALSDEAVLFEKAYCNVAVCGASRASLMTGVRPSADRFLRYFARADEDMGEVPTLPEYFKENGYATLGLGKIFHEADDSPESWSEPVVRPLLNRGWRDYQNPKNKAFAAANNNAGPTTEVWQKGDGDYSDDIITKRGIQKLDSLSQTDKPFFLGLGYRKPHLPFAAPQKYWDLYDREGIEISPIPDVPANCPKAALHEFGELRDYLDIPSEGRVPDSTARKMIHGYGACISYVDDLIGQVIAELKRLDLYDNTIIVVWGDHGWQLGDHSLWCKHANFDLAMNTVLLYKPVGQPKKRKLNVIVELLDLYPTLCAGAGLEIPEHAQGSDLNVLLETGKKEGSNVAFVRYREGESVVTPDYIYSQWPNLEGKPSMLYDHGNDPLETNNVVDQPEYAEVRVKLSGKLDSLRKTL